MSNKLTNLELTLIVIQIALLAWIIVGGTR
jgi:hypothetical protein